MWQRENIQSFNQYLALRPQHEQHNKIPNPKVVQHQLIKKYVTRETKHINIPHPVMYQSMTPMTTRGINSHQRLLLVICTLPT